MGLQTRLYRTANVHRNCVVTIHRCFTIGLKRRCRCTRWPGKSTETKTGTHIISNAVAKRTKHDRTSVKWLCHLSPKFWKKNIRKLEEASTHKSATTHAGNVFFAAGWLRKSPRAENWRSATVSAAGKWRRENPVSLAWLVRRGIAAGKPQRNLRTQQAAILRSVWEPTQPPSG